MKSTILLLLAVAAFVTAGPSEVRVETPAEVPQVRMIEAKEPTVVYEDQDLSRSSRASLVAGQILPGDRLLYMQTVAKIAMSNAAQTETIVFNGYATTRISSVLAREVGATQGGNARITGGGLGYSFVHVQFTSAVGRGYRYQLEIWGR